jgi:hypothetical protein
VSFVKLHESITDSTIWDAEPVIRLVWISLLLKCDRNGNFQGTPESLARWANVTTEDMRRALDYLMTPDPQSTTPDDDGRRVLSIGQNLWSITNYLKYRMLKDPDENREKSAARSRAYRDRHVSSRGVTQNHPIADADAEADAENTTTGISKDGPVSVAWWFKEWNALAAEVPTLPACRVPTERRKAALRARLEEHGEDGLRELLRLVRPSPFLCNEVPPNPEHPNFRVDVDWVLNPSNAAKILEGRYSDKAAPRAKTVRERFAEQMKNQPPVAGGGDGSGGPAAGGDDA